ncbi:MAG: iron-containing alcohol dehydrogenase [Acidobacteria bacterium]|nr:iron-containing alcohol dehydrogenase [Acidobacteriota bacterium]
MRFEFATATRIVFGPGRIREAISAAASLGSPAFLVSGNTPARIDPFARELGAQNVECVRFSIAGEPTIPAVVDGVRIAREAGCTLVIGYGGGSVLDTAKAVAALMANPGDPLDYLEVVGRGRPLTQPCAPCICIPTTAGTGCEVTRNAVLIAPEHRVKVSLRSPRMLPFLAVVDPELTCSLPPGLTAATGMDALTQLIEPFVCISSNPMTDAICREGIRRAAISLRAAYADGNNAEARENMALASLFGGLALANAGLGAVHGLAAPLGGMFPVPHGIVSANLLPVVMETNLKVLRTRSADSPALPRYDEVAHLLTGKASAEAEEGVEWIRELTADLSFPRLSSYGIAEADLTPIAWNARKSSSMKGNPIELTVEELTGILKEAL